jgi:hypothetical protein
MERPAASRVSVDDVRGAELKKLLEERQSPTRASSSAATRPAALPSCLNSATGARS